MESMSFKSEAFEDFRRGALERAKAVDRRERLPSKSIVSFESPVELARLLSPRRVALLQSLSATGSQSLSRLAEALGRKRTAVKKDAAILAEVGAVFLTRRVRDGIRETWVKPAARHFEFNSTIGGREAEASKSEYAEAS